MNLIMATEHQHKQVDKVIYHYGLEKSRRRRSALDLADQRVGPSLQEGPLGRLGRTTCTREVTCRRHPDSDHGFPLEVHVRSLPTRQMIARVSTERPPSLRKDRAALVRSRATGRTLRSQDQGRTTRPRIRNAMTVLAQGWLLREGVSDPRQLLFPPGSRHPGMPLQVLLRKRISPP